MLQNDGQLQVHVPQQHEETLLMRLKESIDEILARTDSQFAESFYGLLFHQHPELRKFFSETDMRVQKSKLTMALQVVAYHHRHPNAAMSDFIEHLGSMHRLLKIAPLDLFKFRDVLLAAIENFHGDNWSEALGHEWSEALDHAIELMNADADTTS